MAPAQLTTETNSESWQFFAAGRNVKKTCKEFDGNALSCRSINKDMYLKQNIMNEGTNALKEDAAVNILEISRSRDIKLVSKEDPDDTENSSSFADTASGDENTSGFSDAEVESQFFGEDDLAPSFDELNSIFPRKKKLTAHWRSFIHPLMWRSKWTEIKLKELESQAAKYEKYAAIQNQRKHKAPVQPTFEQGCTKLVPYRHLGYTSRPQKRMKRKRVEDTSDLALYMSNHVLFSPRENKRLDLDAVLAREDLRNSDQHTTADDDFGLQDDGLFPEDNDNHLEKILRKIELVHSRVHTMKVKLDSVMINNAGRFSEEENLSQDVAGDVQASSVRSPTLSACNGDTVSAGGLYTRSQHMLDYNIGDFIMTDGAISSFGEAVAIPDITESTVGLLSSIDVTQHQAQTGDSSEKILDNILLHTDMAEAEGSTYKNDHNKSAEKTQDADNSGEEDSNKAITMNFSEIHFPKNKRKRGERKGGSGNWNRQRPGEQDS